VDGGVKIKLAHVVDFLICSTLPEELNVWHGFTFVFAEQVRHPPPP
jgi:hypothetical protein